MTKLKMALAASVAAILAFGVAACDYMSKEKAEPAASEQTDVTATPEATPESTPAAPDPSTTPPTEPAPAAPEKTK